MQEYSVAMIQENFQKACIKVSPLKGFYVRIPKEKGEGLCVQEYFINKHKHAKSKHKAFSRSRKKMVITGVQQSFIHLLWTAHTEQHRLPG